MKIGVNLTHLTSLNSGAKTYFSNLFEALLKIDIENRYYFFLPDNFNLNEFNFLKKKKNFYNFYKITSTNKSWKTLFF